MNDASFEVISLSVRDPQTVCCEEALLAVALQSLGVRGVRKRNRDCSFEILDFESPEAVTVWNWHFETQSADGKYETAKLMEWWRAEAWRAANPTHELVLIHTVLHNMAEEARRIRETEARLVLRRGDLEVRIPANASPARRQWLIDQLEGRIEVGSPFVEPAAA